MTPRRPIPPPHVRRARYLAETGRTEVYPQPYNGLRLVPLRRATPPRKPPKPEL